ncbi:MAG: glycosyltransferase family 4 protein [Clostridiales bacterium]|nr:glycosyltransferase family 4 protein [Clostridiales bacterium]
MKILMLTWEYPPNIVGGIARVVHDLSKKLVEKGHEVHVITYQEGNTKAEENDEGVYVHRVKNYMINTNSFTEWIMQLNFCMTERAISLINTTGKFDLIHAHDWLTVYSAKALKHGFDIPITATIHATENGRQKGIHNELQRYINDAEWLLSYEAQNIICNSYFMKSEIQNLFKVPFDKVDVIPNGINTKKFDGIERDMEFRRNYAADNEKIIFFAGRLVPEKGVQVLFDAFMKVKYHYNDVKIVIAGKGAFMDELKQKANDLGISDKVYFTGLLNDKQITKMYKCIDVAVFPSTYEPFGIVALEGMLSGTPTVVSDTGGLNEIVKHGVDGMKSYAGNANSLADSILEILFNQELAKQISKSAINKVKANYNWDLITDKTVKIYEKTIGDRASVQESSQEKIQEDLKETVKRRSKKAKMAIPEREKGVDFGGCNVYA